MIWTVLGAWKGQHGCVRALRLAGADWGVTTSLLVRQTGFLTLAKRPKFGPADYLRCLLLNRAGYLDCLPGRDVSSSRTGTCWLHGSDVRTARTGFWVRESARKNVEKSRLFGPVGCAVGCPRRSVWSSGEPRLIGGPSRAPTLRRAQNLAHFGPRRASGSALRCRRCQNAGKFGLLTCAVS